jgi:hypothetical protein
MYIRDLNFEFEKLESTEDVDSAQAATATLHKDWLDIKSVDVSAQKGLVQFVFFEGKTGKRKKKESTRSIRRSTAQQGEPRRE